jgi:hypothetical protein
VRYEKKDSSYSRPPGRLAPAPAALAYAQLALAALESRARQGEIIVLYEEATVVWRFARPRAGGWRTAPRARLPIHPVSQSQLKRHASRKRPAWGQYRSGSRVTSGVVLRVIGAVPRMGLRKASLQSCRTLLPRSYATISSKGWPPSATPVKTV